MDQELMDYYWDVMRTITNIRKSAKSHNNKIQTEMDNIYALAFIGLIRNDAPFEIQSNADEIEEKKNVKRGILSGKEPDIPDLVEKLIIHNPGGDIYKINLDILRNMLKSEFNTLILNEQKNNTDEFEGSEIEMPDIDFSDEDKEDTNEESFIMPEKEELVNDDDENSDDLRLPSFIGDARYNRDPEGAKTLSTFCFTHIEGSIDKNEEENSGIKIDFYIYPLEIKDKTPSSDIFVIAKCGEIIGAGVSKGKSSAVKIEMDELSFIVRGKWDKGKFQAQTVCLNEDIKGRYSQKASYHAPLKRTYSTFVKAKLGNKEYNIFPGEIACNSPVSGYCACAIVFEENKKLNILTPTSEGTFTLKDNRDNTVSLQTYWTGKDDPAFNYYFSAD